MENKLTVDRNVLLSDLGKLGIRPGMDVLVHSSLSAIGCVTGGADSVIDSLLEMVDPTNGTVLVPTLTGTIKDGPAFPPQFHQSHSPCWTGVIPETFRKHRHAIRSLHPTHSVAAIGRQAAFYTADHEDCLTPCGAGSPYLKLSEQGGSILLLGVTLESNTMFHAVEEIQNVKYHLQQAPTRCVMHANSGETLVRDMILHDWGTGRNFNAMQSELLSSGIMKAGMIGQAPSFLIDARPFIAYTTAKLEKYPNAFIR